MSYSLILLTRGTNTYLLTDTLSLWQGRLPPLAFDILEGKQSEMARYWKGAIFKTKTPLKELK